MQSLPYVALSYCWGTSNNFVTRTSNLKEHEEGMEIAVMPKTIQDAITVCRNVGINYLWVDAICIAQDDSSEWEMEASKMHHIYMHARLTIAASGAGDAEGGLFFPQPSADCVKLGYWTIDKKVNGIIFIESLIPNLYGIQQPVQGSKWMTRGWTLQERILSCRIVHFTQHETIFECRGGLQRDRSGFPDLEAYAWLHQYTRSLTLQSFTSWFKTLEDYTENRHLTRQEDKLFAVRGIAGLFYVNRLKKLGHDPDKTPTLSFCSPEISLAKAYAMSLSDHEKTRRSWGEIRFT
jgi:hypothetical protein